MDSQKGDEAEKLFTYGRGESPQPPPDCSRTTTTHQIIAGEETE